MIRLQNVRDALVQDCRVKAICSALMAEENSTSVHIAKDNHFQTE